MRILACALVIGGLSASNVVYADSCAATYTGVRAWTAAMTCPTGEVPNCSCTTDGCNSSCGNGKRLVVPSDVFPLFVFSDSGLRGFRDHIDQISGGAWVVQVDANLPDDRITRNYQGLTFSGLLAALSSQFGACYELDTSQRVVTFRPAGRCS